jgi:hypothetical protein
MSQGGGIFSLLASNGRSDIKLMEQHILLMEQHKKTLVRQINDTKINDKYYNAKLQNFYDITYNKIKNKTKY